MKLFLSLFVLALGTVKADPLDERPGTDSISIEEMSGSGQRSDTLLVGMESTESSQANADSTSFEKKIGDALSPTGGTKSSDSNSEHDSGSSGLGAADGASDGVVSGAMSMFATSSLVIPIAWMLN